jgi:hypothetical protein
MMRMSSSFGFHLIKVNNHQAVGLHRHPNPLPQPHRTHFHPKMHPHHPTPAVSSCFFCQLPLRLTLLLLFPKLAKHSKLL